jgi:hypothetical protein
MTWSSGPGTQEQNGRVGQRPVTRGPPGADGGLGGNGPLLNPGQRVERVGKAADPGGASSLILGSAVVPLVANLEEGDGIHGAMCSCGRAGDSMHRR